MCASSRKTPLTSQPWEGASSQLPNHRTHCLAPPPDRETHEGRTRSALGHSSVLSGQHRAWYSRWTRGRCWVKQPMGKEPEALNSREGSMQPVLEAL